MSNKSAYLCGVMNTYRQKTRAGASSSNGGSVQHQGPDEEKIKVGHGVRSGANGSLTTVLFAGHP